MVKTLEAEIGHSGLPESPFELACVARGDALMESQMTLPEPGLKNIPGLDQLEAYLHRRLLGKIRGFCLIVKDQGLILRGQARTYYAKQLAQHAVVEAADFPILANEIEVF
jgi:hypothetical protein